jgi:hypothetical protein
VQSWFTRTFRPPLRSRQPSDETEMPPAPRPCEAEPVDVPSKPSRRGVMPLVGIGITLTPPGTWSTAALSVPARMRWRTLCPAWDDEPPSESSRASSAATAAARAERLIAFPFLFGAPAGALGGDSFRTSARCQ